MPESLTHKGASTIGAIVLAAGAAARIGHRPKCLLELNGEPLIQRVLRALATSGIDNIVIVLGHYAERIKPIVINFPAVLVHNPTPDAGQNASLHCGLRALPPNLETIIVALADQPLLDNNDVADLLLAFQHRPATTEVLVPTVDNLPGNPVLFSAAVAETILARDGSYGCKQWQSDYPEHVYRWQTANAHYRIDIDTPGDIDTFAAQTGLPLHWPAST